MTGAGLASGVSTTGRVAAVVTLTSSSVCRLHRRFPFSFLLRGSHGCPPVPRPPPTGHLMVIRPGLLMVNPEVNVERSSSCGSPTTASHCVHGACRRGLRFAFQSYAFQRFMPHPAVLSHPGDHPHPKRSPLPRSVEQLLRPLTWMSLPCF